LELAQRHLPPAPPATRKMESSGEQRQFELTCRVPRCLLQQAPTGSAALLSARHVQWQEAGFERTRPLFFASMTESPAPLDVRLPNKNVSGEKGPSAIETLLALVGPGEMVGETGLLLNRVFRSVLRIRRFFGFALGRCFSSLGFRLRQFHPPHRGRHQFTVFFRVLNAHAVADR